jgi:metal-sulfur cluster biosynthetic enzyme
MNGTTGIPKDNANPVVKAVDSKSGRLNKRPFGCSELQRFRLDNEVERTAEDIAVLQALADVSSLTNGEGVSLLKRVGVFSSDTFDKTAFSFQPMLFGCSDTTATQRGDNAIKGHELMAEHDYLDADEIFDIVRNIQDPEHPLTLEQLGVVSREQIQVRDHLDLPLDHRDACPFSTVTLRFTPTVPHCSMATLIGLAIRVKLHRSLPSRFKVNVSIEPGTHQSEQSVNKQLQDKERVRAALENPHLLKIVNKCIANGMTGKMSV